MPQMVRHKHMQTHAQVAWWETLNSKLKFTFIRENSRENNMLFFHQWYFWIKQPKSSLSLHPSQWCYDSSCVDFLGPIVCFLLVDNDIMTEWIHADRKYLEQKDSEVISAHVWTQRSYVSWPLPGSWPNTRTLCEYSTTSNTVLKWAVPLSVGVLKDPNQPDISATQHAWMKFNYTHIFGLIVLHLL